MSAELGQARVEALAQLERAAAVARERETPDRRPERWLRHRLEGYGAGCDAAGLAGLACAGERIGAAHQDLEASAPPLLPLGRQPVLESGGVGHAEALEELARDQLGGRGPVLLGRQLLEPTHVQIHRALGEPDLADRDLHGLMARVPANHAKRLAQRVARRQLGPIGPQEADQMLTTASLAWGAGEIDEQREVLAPEQLGRRGGAIDRHLDRPERPADDHRGLRSSERRPSGNSTSPSVPRCSPNSARKSAWPVRVPEGSLQVSGTLNSIDADSNPTVEAPSVRPPTAVDPPRA